MAPTPPPLLSIRASSLARLHTVLSLTAFLSALAIGCALHYRKIVKNGVAGYPQEWFPSVSATIGDWYPERNVFQLLIALNAGPRFALLFLTHALTSQAHPSRSRLLLATGILRSLACGGWVFVTSSDDHDAHDALMILYIVLNVPWMWAGLGAAGRRARRWRVGFATAFWLALVPMIYFFVQHKVHRVPGAYTHYAFFEWSLIFLDIAYDATTEMFLADTGLRITLAIPHETSALLLREKEEVRRVKAQEEEEDRIPIVHAQIVERLPVPSKPQAAKIRAAIEFASDIYSAYVFWTLLTGLPVTLFYFSVWKLALTGSEGATLATLAPVVLGIVGVRRWARTRAARFVLAVVSLVALAAYPRDSVRERLGAVVVGVMASTVRLASEWDGAGTGYSALVFVLGLMLSALSKHLNDSNNPLWPAVDDRSGGAHPTLLAIGALAAIEQLFRDKRSLRAPERARAVYVADTEAETPRPDLSAKEPWLRPALALGALVYGLHERLSDPAALVAWSWTGFAVPLRGPHPHDGTALALVFGAMAAGVIAGVWGAGEFEDVAGSGEVSDGPASGANGKAGRKTAGIAMTRGSSNIFAHPAFFALGAFSSVVLVYTNDWPSYTAALVHAFFLTASAPLVIHQAARAARERGPARVFGAAWAVWIVFLFIGTFTVAYAFVPGAWAFRERTDLVLGVQLVLLAPAFAWRSPLPHVAPLPSPTRSHAQSFLALLFFTSLAPSLLRSAPLHNALAPLHPIFPVAPIPTPHPIETHERARLFRAGIWTVHFGIDFNGRDSQRVIRDLVRGMELDVVGLLETDLFRPVFGNRDLTRVMARELGYYVDIGPGPDKHTWGAVLLSKFPILQSVHHLLPSPDGELAPAIEAVLDVYGVNVTTVVAHNGQEETPVDRELQATELARIMDASPYPVLFLGYVVTKPHAKRPAPYEIMTVDGRVHDIEQDDFDRWCEYIFYRGLYRTAYARVSRGKITDTELQVGQFVVPRPGESISGEHETADMRYLRSWKEDMPEDHWFPPEYYGNEHEGGVDGHYYHVFNTPLYYKLPPDVQI